MPRDYAHKGSRKTGRSVSKRPTKKGATRKKSSEGKSPKASGGFSFKAFLIKIILLLVLVAVLAAAWYFYGSKQTGSSVQVSSSGSGPTIENAVPVKLGNQQQLTNNDAATSAKAQPSVVQNQIPVQFQFQAAAASKDRDGYFLQLGTYQSATALQSLQDQLAKHHIKYKSYHFVRLGQHYTRLHKGPYETQQEAKAEQASLQTQGIYSVIVH